ncbi:MAG: hypothetical protein IJ598_08235 [Ruminococcus sp.]|nr:hypothetical protein [Ruminococcus sp.]
MKKLLAVLLAAVLVASALPFTVFAAEGDEVLVISEDGSYTIDASQTNPVDITGANVTVTLSNANLNGGNAQNPVFKRSAIKVSEGAKVTFVLEGYSTISGYTEYGDKQYDYSCGIEVARDSAVTFEGEGTLKVTGGNYGAAIGSYGTERNYAGDEKINVGTITINSGNILAYGGYRGAGIGAGYHVSNQLITINGGTIRAYAGAEGAAIGNGYGTSGGAIGVKAVGEYTGGTIIINGGDIYASYNWNDYSDFSSFDTINSNDTTDYGCGIGGGYGSSVDLIEINGGKVVAVSGGGGAAIGTARGCSSPSKYNPDAYHCNIKIGGNADVTAVTADAKKDSKDFLGGAAIGTGRGTHTGGTIEITDNAKVVAINASLSPAIGASRMSAPVGDGKSTFPHAESITIGDNVTLFAVSAGEYAVDKDAKTLSISPNYFGSSDRWFFDEPAVAIADIANVKAESPKGEKVYEVPAGSVSLWANIVPPVPTTPKATLNIVAPLAMALRFEDGGVYYSGDSVEVELDKEYKFQMCTVDWTTRSVNGEKKIHKPEETFYPAATAWQHTNHGIYSDDNVGFRGSVVYTVTLVKGYGGNTYDAENKAFTLHKGNYTLRTDTNNCFMAYRFYYDENYDGKAKNSMEYRVTTGIDNVLYDTGSDHTNTLEDFRYTKPLSALSINLPLGATVTAKEYIDDVFEQDAQILITIDEEHPDLCYKNFYWRYANQ